VYNGAGFKQETNVDRSTPGLERLELQACDVACVNDTIGLLVDGARRGDSSSSSSSELIVQRIFGDHAPRCRAVAMEVCLDLAARLSTSAPFHYVFRATTPDEAADLCPSPSTPSAAEGDQHGRVLLWIDVASEEEVDFGSVWSQCFGELVNTTVLLTGSGGAIAQMDRFVEEGLSDDVDVPYAVQLTEHKEDQRQRVTASELHGEFKLLVDDAPTASAGTFRIALVKASPHPIYRVTYPVSGGGAAAAATTTTSGPEFRFAEARKL
jgi:hypothetical protein